MAAGVLIGAEAKDLRGAAVGTVEDARLIGQPLAHPGGERIGTIADIEFDPALHDHRWPRN